ncbi:MAG: MarR family winged helix-turn-helix transcriptional regulator [Cellvibrionaceae bacterium]
MTAPTDELGFPTLMADIHRMFSTAFYRQLKADGINLTRSQWRVIAHLKGCDGLTQSELAERLLIEKAPVGTLIDKLEAAGLLERKADPNDRRVKRVFMTRKAEPLLPHIEQSAMELREISMHGLTADEQTQLQRLLGKVHLNLQGTRNPPSAAHQDTLKEANA